MYYDRFDGKQYLNKREEWMKLREEMVMPTLATKGGS
jgi:hypothetical protein